MSLWTKIGLPDQTMVAEIQEELHALREENQRLMAEHTQFLAAHIQRENAHSDENIKQEISAKSTRQCELMQNLEQKIIELKRSQSVSFATTDTFLEQLQSSLNDAIGKIENEVHALRDESQHLIVNRTQLITDCVQAETTKSAQAIQQKIDTGIGQHTELKQKLEVAQQSQSEFRSAIQTILEELQESLRTSSKETKQENIQVKDLSKRILAVVDAQKALLESMALQDKLNEIPEIHEFLLKLWDAMKLVWINDLLDCYEAVQH